ncbi:hypothetical protein JCM16303_003652 [Sporobolomyces ruberrimus]
MGTSKPAKTSSNKKTKSGEQPLSTLPYHVFKRKRYAELKAADPDGDPADRRKQISEEWKESDDNPKNQGQESEE